MALVQILWLLAHASSPPEESLCMMHNVPKTIQTSLDSLVVFSLESFCDAGTRAIVYPRGSAASWVKAVDTSRDKTISVEVARAPTIPSTTEVNNGNLNPGETYPEPKSPPSAPVLALAKAISFFPSDLPDIMAIEADDAVAISPVQAVFVRVSDLRAVRVEFVDSDRSLIATAIARCREPPLSNYSQILAVSYHEGDNGKPILAIVLDPVPSIIAVSTTSGAVNRKALPAADQVGRLVELAEERVSSGAPKNLSERALHLLYASLILDTPSIRQQLEDAGYPQGGRALLQFHWD